MGQYELDKYTIFAISLRQRRQGFGRRTAPKATNGRPEKRKNATAAAAGWMQREAERLSAHFECRATVYIQYTN
jgi:hypothetical protein